MTRPDTYPLVFATALSVLLLVMLQGTVSVIRKEERLHSALEHGNVARGVLHAADVFSVLYIVSATITSCVHGDDVKMDALWSLVFGVGATVVYALVSRASMRTLLQARMLAELARGNPAAGVAAAGHAVATGILVGKSIAGDDWPSLGLGAVFFILGQLTLHAYVAMFRALTKYDDSEEILGENVAAALSYAGVTVALSIIIGRALEGTFSGWLHSLTSYGSMLLYGLGLYVVRQVLVQVVILRAGFALRGGRMDEEIARDRNVGIGALEGASYIGAALLLAKLG